MIVSGFKRPGGSLHLGGHDILLHQFSTFLAAFLGSLLPLSTRRNYGESRGG
jgi:hypothetical protein